VTTKNRPLLGMLVCAGCIALMAASAHVQSEELIVRSGSKTISVTSGKTPSKSSPMTSHDFVPEMLKAHNGVRAKAGLSPLQWSDELAAYSQKWANQLIAKNKTAHNSRSVYGENILATGLGSTPSSVVAEWASEAVDYSYSNNSCKGDCGHYTQLVWRNTQKVGCAMAGDSRREIWVCSYDPPGNYRGERPY
jgi:pathogenesis-related protein 1